MRRHDGFQIHRGDSATVGHVRRAQLDALARLAEAGYRGQLLPPPPVHRRDLVWSEVNTRPLDEIATLEVESTVCCLQVVAVAWPSRE